MPISYSTIACDEIAGTKQESGSITGVTASVQLRCAWTSRWSLVDDLITNRRAWPWFAAAKAVSASISDFKNAYVTDGQGLTIDEAVVTVNYSTEADQDLYAESIEPTTEFRLLDHRAFRWGSASGTPLTEQEAPGQLIRGLNLVRTSYNLAAVPASLLTLQGSVNVASYNSALLGITFAAQTLLFGVQPITRTIKLSGTAGFTVTTKMSFRASGWNKFWNQRTQTYESIYVAGGGVYNPYPTGDFSGWLF